MYVYTFKKIIKTLKIRYVIHVKPVYPAFIFTWRQN